MVRRKLRKKDQQKNLQQQMIDKFYIDSAKQIRKEFIRLSSMLVYHEEDLRKISELLLETSRELQEYSDNQIDKEKNVDTIKNYIVSKLEYLDDESNKIAKRINPINEGIEKLKQDEMTLYNTIKNKYKDLSDEDIISEIQKNLED